MSLDDVKPGTSGVPVDQVTEWLMFQALGDADVHRIVAGCCDRLLAAGIPLWRGFVNFRTLHPLFARVSFIWRRQERSGTMERLEHLHGEAFTSDEWRQSPMHHMVKTQIPFLRRRMVGEGALLDFPVCRDLRDQGGTDYLAYMVPFASEDACGPQEDGIIGSWTTDRASGFTDGDIRALARTQRRLAVSCKVQIKQQITHDVLSTYLGMDAGQQVLRGQIKRGDGERLHAVIWYSDMRNSTRLGDSMPAKDFLKLINTYFECTAGAVLGNGGEVLRFIGDAVLAIFPIRGGRGQKREACYTALAAAREAETRMEEVNGERAAHELEPLDFGLGLHIGDVIFGNIGVPERLEFSVVGPAANEVARLEALTKSLHRRVLLSGEFVRYLAKDFEPLGSHALHGVGTPVEVFAPTTAAAPALALGGR